MLAFMLYQQSSASFLHISAFFQLFCVVFVSKIIVNSSIFSVGITNFSKDINVYRCIVTIFAIAFSILSMLELEKILETRTDELNKTCLLYTSDVADE